MDLSFARVQYISKQALQRDFFEIPILPCRPRRRLPKLVGSKTDMTHRVMFRLLPYRLLDSGPPKYPMLYFHLTPSVFGVDRQLYLRGLVAMCKFIV